MITALPICLSELWCDQKTNSGLRVSNHESWHRYGYQFKSTSSYTLQLISRLKVMHELCCIMLHKAPIQYILVSHPNFLSTGMRAGITTNRMPTQHV